MCRRQREQLQPGDGPGGQGRVQKRHGGSQAEIALQLPLQEGHEEGEKLPAYLLEHVPKLTGYVAKKMGPRLPPLRGGFPPASGDFLLPLVFFSCKGRTSFWLPSRSSCCCCACLLLGNAKQKISSRGTQLTFVN